MDKHRRYFKLWFGVLLAVFLMAGCGGGGGGATSASIQTGTLSVSLTDAPAAGGFNAINVTVSKVRVHKSADADEDDAGWSEIVLDPTRKINLLALQNGVLEDLGETPLPEGHYTQLRLVLVSNDEEPLANSIVPTGGTETALVTPSAVQSGIKLINAFDVTAGERVDLVLDFDALKSIVKRGNNTYALKPVIKVIPTALNGITGFVDTSLLGSDVMVTAQVGGEIKRSTMPTQTGEFFLARLALGEYDVVITADGRATAVIAGVPVDTETSITTLSTSEKPIELPTPEDPTTHNISGTVTLNPTSATEVASVAAKQEIADGLTVTVKSQNVDPPSGDPPNGGGYILTLPVAALCLFEYVAGEPITFEEQAGAAGRYTVEASATGYTPQESGVLDISGGNETYDFELTAVTP